MEIGLFCLIGKTEINLYKRSEVRSFILNIKINIKTFKQVKCKRKPLPLTNSELLTKPYIKSLQKKVLIHLITSLTCEVYLLFPALQSIHAILYLFSEQ